MQYIAFYIVLCYYPTREEMHAMTPTKEGLRIISDRIKNYRIDYSLTQKQLADRAGVSLRSIQRFEKGEDIQLGNLIKLLNALELDKNIQMLIPDVTKRPSAFLDASLKRQRVRLTKKENSKAIGKFKWGDEI